MRFFAILTAVSIFSALAVLTPAASDALKQEVLTFNQVLLVCQNFLFTNGRALNNPASKDYGGLMC